MKANGKKAVRDLPPRGVAPAGEVTNYYLNLKNVGRCAGCGGLVEMPCKLCEAREVTRKARRMAELRRRDVMAMRTTVSK